MFSFSEKNGVGVLNGTKHNGSSRPGVLAPVFPAALTAAGADRTAPPWGVLPWDEPGEVAETTPRPSLFMAREVEDQSDETVLTERSVNNSQQKTQESTSDGADSSSQLGAAAATETEEESDDEEEPENEVTNVNAKEAAKAAFLKILHRAKEGDRNAFEEIYQLYHRRIYNAVYGMLSDADDAQDVTQDVFIRLHDALPTLRADEAFSTYLYRIALNLCRDRARRRKRVRFQSIDTPRSSDEGSVEPMDFPDAGKLPEEQLSTDELQVRVREAVQTLSDDHKAVIVMHHFQGMEVNTIAQILDVPSGTVKSRLARGRDQLHRKLRTYLDVQE